MKIPDRSLQRLRLDFFEEIDACTPATLPKPPFRATVRRMTHSSAPRLIPLDVARTLAVVCMVIFHFTFDLALFGKIPPGTMSEPFWYYFARFIAGSFLFLSGVSLWLSHGRGIRWPAFWKRWARIAAAAALVTTASIWLVPGGTIWFGILHAMAATALIGVLALRLPWPVTLALAALILAAAWGPTFPALDPAVAGLGRPCRKPPDDGRLCPPDPLGRPRAGRHRLCPRAAP